MAVSPSSWSSLPSRTLASTTQWSPHSMRSSTSHSMYDSACVTMAHPLVSEMSTAMSPKRFSPGAKGLSSALMVSFSLPCCNTFKLNVAPFSRKLSTARSFATATVSAGGLKDAWLTHDASMALCASPFFAVTAHSEPTIRPTAAAVSDCPAAAPPDASALVSAVCFLRRSFLTACARSVPLSSHTCSVASVGLNLHRTASNANENPPSFRRDSIRSTASPDHPKDPKTPAGYSREASLTITPSALDTGVGMCPPSVGAPRQNPSVLAMSVATSSTVLSSQLSISTATPALVMPRAIACAMALVFPYALA
mmetsp:Transcript_11194/g.47759  ORF Transcript_11194/g.47759 Transcript_11194/m.47759 type:complete len:310 (-) Transcript_11194:361-1290(-)